jgi:hypothetical protein
MDDVDMVCVASRCWVCGSVLDGSWVVTMLERKRCLGGRDVWEEEMFGRKRCRGGRDVEEEEMFWEEEMFGEEETGSAETAAGSC